MSRINARAGLFGLLFMATSSGWTAPASESAASGFSVAVASAALLEDTALLELSGAIAVTSVELSAGTVVAVFESAASTASVTLEFSAATYDILKKLLGVPLRSVVHASGTALVVGTTVVAFVPNTVGEALLWSSRYGE